MVSAAAAGNDAEQREVARLDISASPRNTHIIYIRQQRLTDKYNCPSKI